MLYYHHFFLFLSLFPEPPSGWSNFQPRGNLPKATSFRVKNRSKTNQKQFNFIFVLNELILLSFSPQISVEWPIKSGTAESIDHQVCNQQNHLPPISLPSPTLFLPSPFHSFILPFLFSKFESPRLMLERLRSKYLLL